MPHLITLAAGDTLINIEGFNTIVSVSAAVLCGILGLTMLLSAKKNEVRKQASILTGVVIAFLVIAIGGVGGVIIRFGTDLFNTVFGG